VRPRRPGGGDWSKQRGSARQSLLRLRSIEVSSARVNAALTTFWGSAQTAVPFSGAHLYSKIWLTSASHEAGGGGRHSSIMPDRTSGVALRGGFHGQTEQGSRPHGSGTIGN
jgi:hypothetical protein